ncbi:translation initiation factor eIF 4e-like domain-containing protein [Crepidotus variabilis]|uniref:Translation initiation factor eIF 4e-like domain-containing protein n=1 Tax=Crepidotus variabilis TaxID=179855 RepID=A0A9P6EV05_9AGAR|nr:translation initiation factor eIF 4e-like domain-containing protein [Crepidotus variabilis]
MANIGVAMMDVDEKKPCQAASPKPKNYVTPPTNPEELLTTWTAQNSTDKKLLEFITRWPPSRTPESYGPWISVYRGGITPAPAPNIEGLQAAFQKLVEAEAVTEEAIDQISKENGVVTGKWLVFEEESKIDMLWGKVVYQVLVQMGKGSAKVSTQKDGERHVICVYAQDYTNKEEVKALRKMLRSVGVKWKIGFKTDAYTHLNIYKNNSWNIRPSRFHE